MIMLTLSINLLLVLVIPDDDDSHLGAFWWMRIDVTCVELCVPTCVFVYERRQTIPQAEKSGCHQAHTCEHTFFDGWWYTASTLFLISSAARGSSGVPHPIESPTPPCLAYYTNATPLFLFSLFSLSVFLSLINQCQAVQQQGLHSFPACLLSSAYMSLCPDPPPPPTQQPPSSFHMAVKVKPRLTLPTWKVVQRQHKKKKESEEEAFLSLQSFFSCGHRKTGFHSHLNNSWDTQEKTGHWVVK